MRHRYASLLLCWLAAGAAGATDIAAQNSWSFTIDRSRLAAGAGSNLASPIDSTSTLLTIDITNTSGAAWAVKAHRSDLTWASGTGLSVRRTSDGSGTGTINGGGAYVGLGSADQTLFSGTGDRTGVRIVLRLDGASIATAPGNYAASVVYTLQ
jgi:hypothetical protein